MTICDAVAAADGWGADTPAPRLLDAVALRSLDVVELRTHRHALAAEAARVGRWRRVVRARIDLVVAVAVPVDRIGADDLVLLQLGRLTAELGRGDSGCGTASLPGLRDTARALARYDERVRDRLADASAELVDRYTGTPHNALVAGPAAG